MTWRESYYTEVTLDRFLPELWPFVSFSHLSTEVLVSATPPTVFKGFWWNFPDILAMTWRWSYFIEVMLSWFLPELWLFNNCSTVSLVSTTPLTRQFSVDFSETFQLFFPRPEEDHIIPRSRLTAFYQSYGSLSVLAILSTSGSCLRNSSYSFQGILMKLSSYCSHDLKMIIFYWGHAQLIFIRVMAL